MRTTTTTAGPFTTILVLGLTAGLGGCAQQPKVSSTWADGVSHGQAFSRVLVVGVTPNLRQRCSFERYLAGQMQSDSTEAFASCDSIDKDRREPLTRESIEQAVGAQRADAVVATVLVSKEMHVAQGGSRDTRGTAGYKATGAGWSDGYYGVYGVPVIYGEFQSSAEISTINADVQLGTKLYETKGATLVYSVETTVRGMESRDEGLSMVTAPIAERLRRDGLIR